MRRRLTRRTVVVSPSDRLTHETLGREPYKVLHARHR